MMLEMKIDKDVMEKISKILMGGEQELVEVYYNLAGTSVYFSTESYANALCIRKSIRGYVITNIELINKRMGTFSKILNVLKELALSENKDIIIENVLTEEMYNFCCKNHLKRIDDEMSRLLPESFVGSYKV